MSFAPLGRLFIKRLFACVALFMLADASVAAPLNLSTGIQKAEAQFEPATAKRGETVTWKLVVDVTPGWHTYPTRQPNPKASSFVSRFDFRPLTADLVKVGAIKEPMPVPADEPELKSDDIQVFNGQVIWQQQFVVHPQAVPGAKLFKIKFNSQVCTTRCIPIRWELETPLTISDAAPVSVDQKFQEDVSKAPVPTLVNPPTPVKPPNGLRNPPNKPVDKETAHNRSEFTSPEEYKASLDKIQTELRQSKAGTPGQASSAKSDLWAFLLAGVFWGGISLVTPCVFPMIPITVSFFLKQADKEHHRPVTMALVYCGTIVVVLTIAAVVLLSAFRLLSVHPVMNFVLGALFVFFALSLFGMYEIELSSSLTLGFFLSVIAFVFYYFIFKLAAPWNYLGATALTVIYLGTLLGLIQKGSINLAQITSSRESKGGLGGTMFMALTFTIISFACVAPFLGGFGGTAATSQFTFLERVLGGLAFSVTFAAPFFVLALFPTLLKNLPRSGSWLNLVKVVMGFLELAAALKFFRAAELVLKPKPVFFTYDLVLAMYVILCLLSGLYLLSLFRLPHDTPEEHIGVPRLMFGFIFLSLAVYFLPALFKQESGESQRPNGTIYSWIDSFLLPDSDEDRMWSGNLAGAVTDALAQQMEDGKKLVFVDFTGETCTNCKINENTVFRYPEIRDLLQSYQLVKLYTDKVPNQFYSSAVRSKFGANTDRQQEDAQANLVFQKAAFGTEQLPLYVILEPKPDGTIHVLGIYDEGKINDETAFAEFLKSPVKTAEGVAQARTP